MKTEAQKRARNKYRPKIKQYAVQCYPADGDVIEKLEAEKQGDGYNAYIKKLIREDIALDKVAKDVIAGKYGDAAERFKKLTEAGYSYHDIQNKVNALLNIKKRHYKK
jgi:hypothetical protein